MKEILLSYKCLNRFSVKHPVVTEIIMEKQYEQ